MIESLLSSNTSNHFNFMVTPARGKNLGPLSKKCNYVLYLQGNQGLWQHAPVTYTKWALKVGSLLVVRVQRLEWIFIIHIL